MIPFSVNGSGRFFTHDTDIGIIGRGVSVESSFEEIANVMFSLLIDLENIHQTQVLSFEFQAEDNAFALVTWLKLLLDKANERQLIFCDFRLKREGNLWKATVAGAPWRNDAQHKHEIKGVMLERLSVAKIDHLWEARCVVDV